MSKSAAGGAPPHDEYLGEHHVYEPHRVGLPNLRVYFRELWARRQFIYELARSALRAQNYNNVFGQLWLVLNPLLLGTVYFLLVNIIRGGSPDRLFFPHLLTGLFAFYFVMGCVSQSASSVTGGGRLILNTAFPRLMLPISQVLIAFMRFLPTLLIIAVIHTVSGIPISPVLLMAMPVFVMVAFVGAGIGFLFATLQVYFRDTTNFLPYLLRIWLYLSPVLWFLESVEDNPKWQILIAVNPMAPILGAWSDVLIRDRMPDTAHLMQGSAWALGLVVVGALVFMSREREFAVRL